MGCVFLLLCLPGHLWLKAMHCEPYLIESWVFLHSIKSSWAAKSSGVQISYLETMILSRVFFYDLLSELTAEFSSVVQSCPTLCDPVDCSTPGLPVHHHLPESTQTHVHWVGDAIQPSHPLLTPSLPAFNLSQHQGLFQWVSSSHQVAKVLEFQLQHQSFQWIFRTNLL